MRCHTCLCPVHGRVVSAPLAMAPVRIEQGRDARVRFRSSRAEACACGRASVAPPECPRHSVTTPFCGLRTFLSFPRISSQKQPASNKLKLQVRITYCPTAPRRFRFPATPTAGSMLVYTSSRHIRFIRSNNGRTSNGTLEAHNVTRTTTDPMTASAPPK